MSMVPPFKLTDFRGVTSVNCGMSERDKNSKTVVVLSKSKTFHRPENMSVRRMTTSTTELSVFP